MLGDFRCRLLVHCILRCGARLRLPHLRRSLLHRLSIGTKGLGSLHQLGCGMDQPARSDCRCRFFRVWICPDPPRRRVHGFGRNIHTHPSSNCRRHGRFDHRLRHCQLTADILDGENDQVLRHLPRLCFDQLLRRLARVDSEPQQRDLCFHWHHSRFWLVASWIFLPLWILVCVMDHD